MSDRNHRAGSASGGPSQTSGTQVFVSQGNGGTGFLKLNPPLHPGDLFVAAGREALLIFNQLGKSEIAEVYDVIQVPALLSAKKLRLYPEEWQQLRSLLALPGVHAFRTAERAQRENSFVYGQARVLKVLKPQPDPKTYEHAKARMWREIDCYMRLASQRLAPQFITCGERPWPYIVLERIPGLTLGQYLRNPRKRTVKVKEPKGSAQGFLPGKAFVMPFVAGILRGLIVLHEEFRLVHRDLKPENLMVAEARDRILGPVLLDFGIVGDRRVQSPGEQGLTQIFGPAGGTPQWMAPEQALGQPTSYSADLYALGRIITTMLRNDFPFDSIDAANYLHRYHDTPPECTHPELSSSQRAGFDDLCQQMCAPDSADRLQSAREALELWLKIWQTKSKGGQ